MPWPIWPATARRSIKGRLKDGETRASAEANLQVLMSQLAAAHPKTNGKRPIALASNVRVHPQADATMRTIAAGLMLGVGLVLLVACVNVTNMLLARALNYNRNSIFVPGRQQPGDPGLPTGATWVDDSYFATLGVAILRGRNFSTADLPSTPKVAIVNESFVRRHWPGEDAIGRRFRVQTPEGPEYQIVGVVADYTVDTVGERPAPYIHYALGQRHFTGQVLMARTDGDAAALLTAMRREVLSLEPTAIFLDSQTMNAQVDMTLLPARLAAQTAGLVGLIATVLAAIGLYGVIAYAVARRTREIGVRMALGAAPAGVVGLVMRQGLTVALVGCAVGGVIAYLAARAIASGLYGVSALDPIAWTGALAALLGSAALANFLPARRASLVDPSVALRSE